MLKRQRKDLLLHQPQNHRLLLLPLSSLGLPSDSKHLFNTCFHFIEKNQNGPGRRWRRRRRVSVVSQCYFVSSTFYSPFLFLKNGFVCSDDEDDDDDEDDEEEDDEEEDIEESPVKARWCFGSSAEYIWWVVSLIFFYLFWVQAKATLSKKKPPAQNGKSPKPNAPAQKQVIYLPFYFQKGSHDILLLVTNITVLFSDTFFNLSLDLRLRISIFYR